MRTTAIIIQYNGVWQEIELANMDEGFTINAKQLIQSMGKEVTANARNHDQSDSVEEGRRRPC